MVLNLIKSLISWPQLYFDEDLNIDNVVEQNISKDKTSPEPRFLILQNKKENNKGAVNQKGKSEASLHNLFNSFNLEFLSWSKVNGPHHNNVQ